MTHSAMRTAQDLPTFERPPVSEVIIAVEFPPLIGVGPFELMAIHEAWALDYPNRALHPAIPSAITSGFEFSLTPGLSPLRLWSQSSEGDVLVQVQADRLVLNWRRVESNEEQPYPSYRSLISRWELAWERLRASLASSSGEKPQPSIVEVSYVNTISLEKSTQAFSEFTYFPAGLAEEEVGQATSRFVLVTESDAGAGHTIVQAEVAADDSTTLTSSIVTRLAVSSDDPDFVLRNALDAAHVASVTTFARSASARMKDKWGLK